MEAKMNRLHLNNNSLQHIPPHLQLAVYEVEDSEVLSRAQKAFEIIQSVCSKHVIDNARFIVVWSNGSRAAKADDRFREFMPSEYASYISQDPSPNGRAAVLERFIGGEIAILNTTSGAHKAGLIDYVSMYNLPGIRLIQADLPHGSLSSHSWMLGSEKNVFPANHISHLFINPESVADQDVARSILKELKRSIINPIHHIPDALHEILSFERSRKAIVESPDVGEWAALRYFQLSAAFKGVYWKPPTVFGKHSDGPLVIESDEDRAVWLRGREYDCWRLATMQNDGTLVAGAHEDNATHAQMAYQQTFEELLFGTRRGFPSTGV